MKYKIDQEWLETRYVVDLAIVDDIAREAGCTVANIKRLLKKWKIYRGKALQQNGIVPAWNKGLTKHEDSRLMKISEGHIGENNPMAGRDAWNKGLTKDTDDRVAAVSAALTGVPKSEEHRARLAKSKAGLTGIRSNRWIDGRSFVNQYVVARIGGAYIYEHRAVAEEILGRRLQRDEQVHHIDKNTRNNDPRNLIVISDDDHTRLHHAMRERPTLDQRAWLAENHIKFEDLSHENTKRKAA